MTVEELQRLVVLADTGGEVAAAAALGLEARTLRNSMYRLRQKLGAKTNLQAYHMLLGSSTIRISLEKQ